MTTIIVIAAIIIAAGVWLKIKMAKNKSPEQRTAFESVLATAAVASRREMEEAANTLRTASISREEGIQLCKDSMRDLKAEYIKEETQLFVRKGELEGMLPGMKDKPGKYGGQAKIKKDKYDEAVVKGNTEVAEMYKAQSCKYLKMKQNALARIEKAETFIKSIDLAIEKARLSYESNMMELEENLEEFRMMQGEISAARFNAAMGKIQDLRQETAGKLREQDAEIRATNFAAGRETEDEGAVYDFGSEFDKL